MTPQDALRQMAKAYPGGYESLAPRVGKTVEVLRKELSGDPKFKLGLSTSLLISELCIEAKAHHRFDFVNAVAADGGGFVRLPVVEMSETACVNRSISAVTTELSHVVTATLEGDADGHISDNDKARILKEVADARAALQQLEHAIEAKHAAGMKGRQEQP
ncbi:UNVERIFIED_CONTAM: transcriptional regulator [Comamonas sp. A-3]|uniref:phage regulatory CII family protein n=1 Tax=Comamonas sp. TaxID=34028 RepID=UPI0012C7D5DF|nr:phage regulatory CII family protein [Comamonas sp.]MPS93788.1 transcriptional regulator [Comamonas sp.]